MLGDRSGDRVPLCCDCFFCRLSSSSASDSPGLAWGVLGAWTGRLGAPLMGDLLRRLQRSHWSQIAPHPQSATSSRPSAFTAFFLAFFFAFLGSLASSLATISMSSACVALLVSDLQSCQLSSRMAATMVTPSLTALVALYTVL